MNSTEDPFIRTIRCSPLFFKSLDEFVRVALHVLFALIVGGHTPKKPLELTEAHLNGAIDAFTTPYMQPPRNDPLYIQKNGKSVLGIRLVRILECLRDERPEITMSKCKPVRSVHLHAIETLLLRITQLCIVMCVRLCKATNLEQTRRKRQCAESDHKHDDGDTTTHDAVEQKEEQKGETDDTKEADTIPDIEKKQTNDGECRREGIDDDDDDDGDENGRYKTKKKKHVKYKQYQSIYLTDALVRTISCTLLPSHVEPPQQTL